MAQTDFIPRRDADFEVFCRNLVYYVLDNFERWGHIPQADMAGIEGQLVEWTDAYTKTLVPHIPQLTAEKKRVRAATERAVRSFVNRFLRWPPVTDLDRDKIGVPNHNAVRSPEPVPSSVPEIETDTSVIRQLSLRLRDFGAVNWAKPAHVHGMELAWGVRTGRPEHVGELPRLESKTANPIVLSFEEAERGCRVFYAARWVNNTSQHGPWSDIESSIIP
ncbi:MAG: hypothetical protein LBQ89_07405 [Treponema sp.]|jgi:hypothetical protein|nr:hypothetical protein [Treponema sp.]